MKNLFYKVLVLILLIEGVSCCKAQKSNNGGLGILKGVTGIYKGNCMPAPNQPPCKPQPISTTVYITELSEVYSPENLVDSVVSSDNGEYLIKLDPGRYSLFLKDEQKVVCPVVQCNPDCACTPFTIEKDSNTTINPNIDHASW